MALRLIEIIAPENIEEEIHNLLQEQPLMGRWAEHLSEERVQINALVDANNVESVLDVLHGHYKNTKDFRAVLINVEATIPLPEKPEKAEGAEPAAVTKEKPKPRISREELYTSVLDSSRLSWVYIVTVILSSIVAAIGILNNSIAIIIGAMVIAPLLGPNVALALATTLGDISLVKSSVKTNLLGIVTALGFSVILGFVVSTSADVSAVAAGTQVRLDSIALALASGSAGALAFTTGLSATLIGVMVAVALLPPLVTLGLLLGAGYFGPALTALQLFLINIACVNLAGVVTFLIQGIHPASWWEAEKAKVSTRIAIAFWLFFLALLVVVTFFWGKLFKSG